MMKKLITVENNEVIVTDVASSEKRIIDYSPRITAEWIVNTLTSLNMTSIFHSGYKHEVRRLYQDAGDELGVSVASFKKQLNGAIYRAYIKPNAELHTRFSLTTVNGKRWFKDPLMVATVNRKARVIREYIDDGISHLAGFGLLGFDSMIAKAFFGKGLWKKLARNSKTRNDIICKKVVESNAIPNTVYDAAKFLVRFLNNTPSTILRKPGINILDICTTARTVECDDMMNKMLNEIGGPLYLVDADTLYTYHHIMMDTHRMMGQIGETFNPRWSFKRMKREHDRAIVIQVKQKSSTNLFPYVGVLPQVYMRDGFTATLCKSHREMAVLGAQEHHCVGSYHNRAYRGAYVVYKIVDDKMIVSTIGITHPNEPHSMDQHYLAYNRKVEDADRLSFAKALTHEVKKDMRVHVPYTPDEPDVIIPPLPANGGVQMDLLAPAPLDDDNIPF